MNLQRSIQPIAYLKANAHRLAEELVERGEPLIVTQHGKAKLVVQDIASYERIQETMALLRLIAMGQKEIALGRSIPIDVAFRRLRKKIGMESARRGRP